MYNGPAQQFPQPPAAPLPPPPRRGGTTRTVVITAAVTLAAYAVVAGAAGAVVAANGAGPGPVGPDPAYEELPTDPCAAASRSQLGSVSARLPSASFSEGSASCVWYAEFSDGSLGNLQVAYRLPRDDDGDPVLGRAEAEDAYEEKAGELTDGYEGDYRSVEVQESRELDIGDEAVVSHFWEGDDESFSRAQVLVRVDSVLIDVAVNEPWEERTGRADFTGEEEVLIAIAERAATLLE